MSISIISRNEQQNKSLSLLDAAYDLHRWGANLLPQRSKRPLSEWAAWQSAPQTWQDVRDAVTSRKGTPAWPLADSIGIVCGPGGWTAIDIDGGDVERTLADLRGALGLPNDYPWQERTTHGAHLYILSSNTSHNGTGVTLREGKYGGRVEHKYRKALCTLKPGRLLFGWPSEPPVQVDPAALIAAYDAVTLAPEKRSFGETTSPKSQVQGPLSASTFQLSTDGLNRARAYALAGLRNVAEEIAATPVGQRNRTLYTRARRMGQYIGAGWLDEDTARQALHEAGQAAGLDARETAATVASGINRGKTETPDGVPDWGSAEQRVPSAECSALIAQHSEPGTRYPHGLPQTLNERILRLHRHIPVEDHGALALVLYLWHGPLRRVLPEDWRGPVSDFQRACQSIGVDVSRRTLDRAFRQAMALGQVEVFAFCDLNAYYPTSIYASKRKNLVVYGFKPWPQQLANFETHCRRILREWAYASVPDDVQPEYADLSQEDVARLDGHRAPVYAQHAAEREVAASRLEQALRLLEADGQRIRQGRYQSVALSLEAAPSRPLANAAAYRRALHRAGLEVADGVRENAYRQQYKLGVSRATLSRIREDNHVVTEARDRIIDCEDLTPYQVAHAEYLVLENLGDGRVRVRAPSAERFATPEEAARIDARKAARIRRRRLRQRRAQTLRGRLCRAGSDSRAGKRPELPETIPAGYSERHMLEQLNYTPGAGALPRCDPETGEIFSAAALWRALADQLARQEGGMGPPPIL